MTVLNHKEQKLVEQKKKLQQQLKEVNSKLRETKKELTLSEQMRKYSGVFVGKDGSPVLIIASSPRFQKLLVSPPLTPEEKSQLVAEFRAYVDSIDHPYIDALLADYHARLRKREQRKQPSQESAAPAVQSR